MSAVLNFPNRPSLGQLHHGPDGILWRWDGVKWTASGGAGQWDINTLDDIPDAPFDGWTYGRRNAEWVRTLSARGGTILNGDLLMQNNSNIVLDYVTPPNLNGPAVIAPHMVSPNYWINSYPNMTTAGSYLTNGGAARITTDSNGNLQFMCAPPGTADTQFNHWTSVMGLQPDGRLNVGWYSKTNDPLLVTTENGFNATIRHRVDSISDWTAGALPDGNFYVYPSGTPTAFVSVDLGNVLNLTGSGIRYISYGTSVFADSWDGQFIHFLVDNQDLGRYATLAFNDTRYLAISGGTVTGALTVNGALSDNPVGRILSIGQNNPSVTVYNSAPGQGAAAMFYQSPNQLSFGPADAAGNPTGTWLWFNGTGGVANFMGTQLNLNGAYGISYDGQPPVAFWWNGIHFASDIQGNRNNNLVHSFSTAGSGYNVDWLSFDLLNTTLVVAYNNATASAAVVLTPSDRRLKSNPRPAPDALSRIRNTPVYEADITFPGCTPKHYEFAFMADEVSKQISNSSVKPMKVGNAESYEMLDTMPLIAALWRATQQIDARLTAIEQGS